MSDGTEIRMRVWVEDAWDSAEFVATPEWTVARMKETAIKTATQAEPAAAGYEVKLRGARVLDENRTLGELGVGDRAPFTVMSKRRRPVR